MEATLEDIRRHFSQLSDEALLATVRDELTDTAKVCFDAELSGRGLTTESPAHEREAAGSPAEAEDQPQKLVVIATFDHAEEVPIAQALLRSAGIPSHRSDERGVAFKAIAGEIELLVPAEAEEQALLVLQSEISDEELAAQAEAAAPVDEDPEAAEEEESDEPDIEP